METNVRLLPGQSQKPRLVASEMLALCASRRMQEVVREITEVARHHVPVVLQGESGVGKDVAARAISEQSSRHDQPFVAVDCTALPSTLVETELFGHEKGAFTDAREQRRGRVEQANGGTLFLDEVGELPVGVQPKFLRALESGTFVRVGGNTEVHSDFRLVVATNRDLSQMVREKAFREDLFYRLHVFPITIPPLRDRRDDILSLAEHFLSRHADDSVILGEEAKAVLLEHSWPGNVRELSNVVRRAVVKADGKTILPEHLFPITSSTFVSCVKEPKTIEDAVVDLVMCAEKEQHGYYEVADMILRRMIERQLQRHHGRVTKVSKALKLNRNTLYGYMYRLGISAKSAQCVEAVLAES